MQYFLFLTPSSLQLAQNTPCLVTGVSLYFRYLSTAPLNHCKPLSPSTPLTASSTTQPPLAWRTIALNLTPAHLISCSAAIGEVKEKKEKSCSVSLLFKIQELEVNNATIALDCSFLIIPYPFLVFPSVDLLFWVLLNWKFHGIIHHKTRISILNNNCVFLIFIYVSHCFLFYFYLTSWGLSGIPHYAT